MNFNSLINQNGIKGTRRGGQLTETGRSVKDAFAKGTEATKDVTVKAAKAAWGWAPATNNKVDRVEYDSLTRDRELIHEVRKNREAIDEMRRILQLPPVPVSTEEEVRMAVDAMEVASAEIANRKKEEERAEKDASGDDVMKRLTDAILGKLLEKPASAEEPAPATNTCDSCGAATPLGYQFADCRKCRHEAAQAKEEVVVEEVPVPTQEDAQELLEKLQAYTECSTCTEPLPLGWQLSECGPCREVSKAARVEKARASKGARHRLMSSPSASKYDYSELTETE